MCAGTRKSTSVPAPGLLQIVTVARIFFARSRMPSNPQFGLTVRYFDLDLMGIRVLKGIDERLAGNERRFLAYDWVQITSHSLDRRTKMCRLLDRELLAQGRERL